MDEETALWRGITGPRMERCLLGKEEINLPEIFMEQSDVFYGVFCQETWDTVLTDKHKAHLLKFLPSFPSNDAEEKEKTVEMLFNLENFKFGNPIKTFQVQIRDGYFSPDIARYAHLCRRVKHREYRFSQQRYYSDLLKDILMSRQNVFEQARHLAPLQPIKFQLNPPVPVQNRTLDQRVKKKYIRLLKDMREEIGVEDTSSEEDEETISPVQRSRRQLFKSLGPIPSPDPTIPSVLATFASKPVIVNGDTTNSAGENVPNKRQRAFSPVEITEDHYKLMIKTHKRKKIEISDLPELDTTNITLEDILSRCQANKKTSKSPSGQAGQNGVKKKSRIKEEKKLKKKIKKEVVDDNMSILDSTPQRLEGTDDILNTQKDIIPDFPLPDHSASDIKTEKGITENYFALLRDLICEFPDLKTTLSKLEEKVRDWQESGVASHNTWYKLHANWPELVLSALKFLSGDALGLGIEDFIPFVDYKERPQQWKWIGKGRDESDKLAPLFDKWFENKDGNLFESSESGQTTPPPRSKTDYVVKESTTAEKVSFREQEEKRFYEPHKPYTYSIHGYEAVVGPVKGVYSKDSAMTKAREHALLVSDRPAYVTILTIVRDAAARLPNGEGTRADICEILKDSKFLSPGVTDAQINTVVSGALDRLHSEKDPCVKYDVNKKIWIYLHRNRSEDEFERIHQAQLAAAKAKKSLQKPKASKANKESSAKAATTVVNTPTTEVNIEEMVAQAHSQAISSSQAANPSPKRSTTIANQLKSQKASPRSTSQKQASVKLNVTTDVNPTAVTATPGIPTAAQLLQAQNMAAASVAAANRASATTPNKEMVLTHAQALKMLQAQGGTLTAVQNPQTSKPEIILQRQISAPVAASAVQQGETATAKLIALSQSTSTTAVWTQPTTSVASSDNPVMARVVQQMTGAQMVSMGNILQAGSPRIPGAPVPRTTIKIQGGSIVQPVSGGKPIQLTGKPLSHSKGLVQIGGKGQPVGLIRTQQGTIISIPQIVSSGIMTLSQPKATVAVAGGKPGTVAQSLSVVSSQARTASTTATSAALGQTTLQHVTSQPKVVSPSQAGIVLTHLPPGSLSLRQGLQNMGQNKVIPASQTGLVPTQFIVHQTPAATKSSAAGSAHVNTVNTHGTPIIVSNVGGRGAQNIQMVRTVLSSQGGIKPGQATILISQPTLQAGGNIIQAGQVLQTNPRTTARGSPKGKTQPVYARIITPPPGITLKTLGQGQPVAGQGVSMIQTVGKLLTSVAQQAPASPQTTTISESDLVLQSQDSPASQGP